MLKKLHVLALIALCILLIAQPAFCSNGAVHDESEYEDVIWILDYADDGLVLENEAER